MNTDLKGDYVTALALQGRTTCKVIGPVEKGDIIVTSAIPVTEWLITIRGRNCDR